MVLAVLTLLHKVFIEVTPSTRIVAIKRSEDTRVDNVALSFA